MTRSFGIWFCTSLVAAIAICVVGCKKKEEPAPPSTQAEAAPKVANATTPAGEQVDLNREVRRWILANRRPPKNFEEFASSSGVNIPPPPTGKKYVLDKSMHVTLK